MPVLERATLDQAELDKLVKIYEGAQRRIIDTFDTATDFGQARRIEQLAQIDTILKGVGVETGDWIESVLPAAYTRGTDDAVTQLTAIKVGIKETSTFSVIDRRAVAALVSETQEAFAMSLTTVSRSANRILSDAVKDVISQELAEGRVLGSTRKEISRRIKSAIQKDGITALVDKGGREWSLDRYAKMLAQTKMVEARNTGLANKMVANGYDLVEVSDHASKHQACAHYEGKILSLTGKTPGHSTIEVAKLNGLFHPGCRHQINAIKSDYAAMTTAYDSRSGQYVQPFKNNPPKPATGTLRVPDAPKPLAPKAITVDGGSFSGAPVINNTLSLGDKIKKTFKLNETEAAFINNTQLRVTLTRNPFIKRISATTRGMYVPKTHSIHVRKLDAGTVHTFYHELGHALDAKLLPDAKWLNADDKVRTALKADARNIIAARMQFMYENQGIKLKFADMVQLIDGKDVEYEIGARKGVLRSDRKWRKYAAQPDEVFADAYAQYRRNPDKFKIYAPNANDMFKEVIK